MAGVVPHDVPYCRPTTLVAVHSDGLYSAGAARRGLDAQPPVINTGRNELVQQRLDASA